MSRKLVIDASCLLNLLASGRAAEILEALDCELVGSPHLAGEVRYLIVGRDETGAAIREPVSLEPLESAGLLRIEALGGPVLASFLRSAEHLKDADAAAVALSVALELPLATDDSRQANVARMLFPSIEIVSTLDLVYSVVSKLKLDDVALRSLARDIRFRASFLPPKKDPHREWFLDLLVGSEP